MSDFALDGFKAALFCNFHCLISNVDGPTRARIHFDETSECEFVHIAQTKDHSAPTERLLGIPPPADLPGPLTGGVSGAPSRNLIARSRPSTLPAFSSNGFTTVL
jgi:hypothetical protein